MNTYNTKMIMEYNIPIGTRMACPFLVEEEDTAISAGSGSLCVLATPAMVAGMEQAAWRAVAGFLPEGTTTVGTQVNIEHLRAIKAGAAWQAIATLTKVDGRMLYFDVEASDEKGVMGRGTHVRAIVDVERFMGKL